uniref:Integrase catalytic domain-containing protein n=1 Tax=Tanacetum cinerariifolium TaxID=118510 RepID=A0A6L2J3Z6_TANCI|nr:hypothetical protein [Tanacetum cinerariifolium]
MQGIPSLLAAHLQETERMRRTLPPREALIAHKSLTHGVHHPNQQLYTIGEGGSDGRQGGTNLTGNNIYPLNHAYPPNNFYPPNNIYLSSETYHPGNLYPPNNLYPFNHAYHPVAAYLTWQSYEQNPLWLDHSRGGYENDANSPSPLTRWIEEFQFPVELKVRPYVGYYDGKEDTYNFIHVFEGAMRIEKWAIPFTCHMFVYILKDAARVWWNNIQKGVVTNYEDLRKRGPFVDPILISVLVYGRQVGRVLLDGETTLRDCFLKLGKEVREKRKDVYTTLSGFYREQVNPVGEFSLQITAGKSPHHRSEQITFLIARSLSPQNMLFGRTAIAELGMIPSTMHSAILYQSEIGPRVIMSIYQDIKRLVDKVFESQIERNMESYMDEIVIKSIDEEDMLAEIQETFERLRRINMKLNPKKCSLEMEEGKFLGHIVSKHGIKANPTKVQALTSLKLPKTIKKYKASMASSRPSTETDENTTNPLTNPPTPQAPHTLSTIKFSILKKGEYDIWAMKMEHYLEHTDYSIWEVIQKGNGLVQVSTDTHGQIRVLPSKTAKEILARERERKARTTLLMAIPEDHLAKFHKMTAAKEMFQSLLSQLETHGAGVFTKDANQKFLRSLPSSWSQVSLIMRTKPGVDTLSFDDLYNNLRVFEYDVKGSAGSSSSTQNVAFVSFDSTSSTNEVNTAYDHEDLKQLDEFDLEEMDLKWQVAMISMRLKKFYKKTGRKLYFDAKSKENQESRRRDVGNARHKAGYNRRRLAKHDESKAMVTIDGEGVDWTGHAEDDTEDYALMTFNSSNSGSDTKMSAKDKSRLGYGTQIHEGVLSYENEVLESVFDSRPSDVEDSPVNDRYVEGMHAVLSPMTGIYMPHKFDFGIDESKFTYGPKQSKNGESDAKTSDIASCDSTSNVETLEFVPKLVESKPKVVSEPKVWSDALIIEEYESESDDKHVTIPSKEQEKPSFAFVNNVKHVKTPRQTANEQNIFSVVGGNKETAVKASPDCNWRPKRHYWNKVSKYNSGSNSSKKDDPQKALKNKGIVDSGCSKGHITGKGTIRTGKLDFEDVCFVKELQHFNLFSVSQMCDKKNKVLFIDTECLVLSPDFKLPDENQVLLRVPKQNNMYYFNLENIVPTGGIKKEYSNAQTPQQNGVAESKNMALIEAARTMLADSFLPNTFWAKAVSTACYVLNRVLVTEPQNKTPYELLNGKIPIISYIRPFGCHVTILNTIDHLGKSEEKYDEGFLVGYSLNSKAFRVYNLETKRVKENMHINFLENKPNVVGKGPTWLFDLDYLTDSMNYQPVTLENKANKTVGPKEANNSAGTQDNLDAGNSQMETEHVPEYFVLPLWSSYTSTIKSSEAKNGGKKPKKDTGLKSNEKPVDQEEQAFLEELERLKRQEKKANDEAKALKKESAQDKTLFIKKDKKDIMLVQVYVDDIIFGSTKKSWCDEFEALMKSRFLMSSMGELTFFLGLQVKQKEDGIFISQDKYVAEILKKFDFMSVKIASTPIETQKPLTTDEEAADVTPKTSHIQAVKRIFKYLNGQPKLGLWYPRESAFDLEAYSDSDYYNNLKFSSRIEQANKITWTELKKLLTNTYCPRTEVKKMEDEFYNLVVKGNDLKTYIRRFQELAVLCSNMVPNSEKLMEVFIEGLPRSIKENVIASKPQTLEEAITITHRLMEQGCYNYAGANLDRKSTTGGCQFLGRRRISWQCKKQTSVSTSTIEAEYVAAANCCGPVLWIQNQMLDYEFNFMNTKIYIDNESTICIVKNLVFHSKTKHIAIRHHFIRDAYGKKLIQKLCTTGTKVNTASLGLCCSKMFHDGSVAWIGSQTINDKKQIHATVDSKAVVVTEASIRSSLLFDDADGDQPPVTESSSSHDTTQDSRDSLEGTNGSKGDQRLSIKKRFVKKESVSKQGRKKDKPKPNLDDMNEGRLSEEIKELKLTTDTEEITQDKGNGEKGGSTEELVSATRTEDSIVRPDVGTADPIAHPTTTTSIFDDEDITMAQTLIKMKEEKAKEKGVSIKDIEDSLRPARSILTLKPLLTVNPKDKGKDAEVARLVYKEELTELEREKEKRQREEEASKAAIAEMYDEVQAWIEADALFAAKLQQEGKEKYTIKERAKFLAETIAAQRRFKAAQRSTEIRSRPPTKSQLRNLMMTYLKNMGGYKHSQLKAKTFAKIQGLYERQKRVIDDFKPMDSDDVVDKEKVVKEPKNTKVEVKQEGDEESIRKRLDKRFKMKATKKSKRQTDSDLKEEEHLKTFLQIFQDEEGEVDYEGDLRTMFEETADDDLWKTQEEWILKSWNFYENYRVHTLTFEDGTKIYMLAERSKELASLKQTAVELAISGQTATGKESSNPFMAESLGEDASKQGMIDDADAKVTFIDETSNYARNKNNKISNSER